MNAQTNWLGNFDPNRRSAFERALNVAGAGTVLLQTLINRTVQQIHHRDLGIAATLPRRPGSGNGAYINRRAPGAAAEWVDDTTEPGELNGTYTQEFFPYKTLLTRGKVTRKLQATGRSYGDILGGEISGRTGDFSETFEFALAIGDVAVDANQFDGLVTLIQSTASQIVALTTATTGDQLDLDKLDEAIDAVKGGGQRSDLLIYASRKGRRRINAELSAQQQFNDMIEIAAGFRVRTYDGIPLITTTGIPDDMVFNGTKVTAYSGAAAGEETTAIIVVNTRYVWIEELTSLTVMPLAKKSSQFDEFDIFWDGTLVVANQLGAAILVGLNTTA